MGKAIFKQNSGILGIAVAGQCGVVTPSQLKTLGELAENLGSPGLKFTTRQTIVFLVAEEHLVKAEEAIEALGLKIGAFGEQIRNVKGCCGHPNFCNRFTADALGLGIEIQEKYMGQPVPKDFKISTAGCGRGCTDPYCADFGATGAGKDSFDIYIGGRGGSPKPAHGRKIAAKVPKEKVFDVLDFVLEKYRQHGQNHERLCKTIERVGWEEFNLPGGFFEEKGIENNDFLEFLKAN